MPTLRTPVTDKDNVYGNAQASIELVEYGDYECPHCGRAYPIIKRIQQAMGDDLKFVFRNFPLSKIHPHAVHAAIATEAAALQGKFWEMHDHIFENQRKLDDASLMLYAEHLGLDTAKFAEDFEKEELAKKVAADFESGMRSGVNATPSFYINGQKYEGDWGEMPFLAHLKSLLK